MTITDSITTGLDEETAFDPSEFFEDEEVAATFDEIIEAQNEGGLEKDIAELDYWLD